LSLEKGPWLKPRVAATMTQLQGAILTTKQLSTTRGQMRVRVKNVGSVPAFNTQLRLPGVKRAFHAADNYFWLAPGEERVLESQILWREDIPQKTPTLTVEAWNARATKLN
jgi:beta-mannosidase